MNKECRKCGKILPIEEFYKHSAMVDGFLNICKECVKERVRKHREANIEKIRKYDRERGKQRKRILKSEEITRKRRKETGYEKAHSKVERAIKNGIFEKSNMCQLCGSKKAIEAHHYDYSKPLDVIWVCSACHKQYHLGKTERAEIVRIIVDNIAKLQAFECV